MNSNALPNKNTESEAQRVSTGISIIDCLGVLFFFQKQKLESALSHRKGALGRAHAYATEYPRRYPWP